MILSRSSRASAVRAARLVQIASSFARDDGKIAGPHATAEIRDEVAAARDDQGRALRGIVDRDRHALRAVRQLRCVEHGAEEIGVAVELQREIHVAAREAIEARQEVLGVQHARLVLARTEGDKSRFSRVADVTPFPAFATPRGRVPAKISGHRRRRGSCQVVSS